MEEYNPEGIDMRYIYIRAWPLHSSYCQDKLLHPCKRSWTKIVMVQKNIKGDNYVFGWVILCYLTHSSSFYSQDKLQF